jgi:uncharacterized protein (TIGR03437 family)
MKISSPATVIPLILLINAGFAFGQSFTISTFAGTGTAGYSGDGGAAILATIDNPYGAAFDADGNMYIADQINNRIRKITPAGLISTFAGTGAAGFSGDGGPALSAQLNRPSSVSFDSLGTLYISDQFNNRVRKITTNGVITTVAGSTQGFCGNGGPATSACLNGPLDVAVDSSGNVYIAEFGNNDVRKVDTNGIITSFAGNGSHTYSGDGGPAAAASLAYVESVAVSAAGDLFIADGANNRIRKVSNGIITTVAGTGQPGWSGDGGAALNAQLNYPSSVRFDSAGNLYIADYHSYRIRLLKTDGTIATIAGNGVAAYSGDGGPALNAALNSPNGMAVQGTSVYFADINNNRIRLLTPSTSITSGGIVPIYSSSNTIQPGSWVSIYGANLANTTATWNGDFPTSLAGTSVTINNKPAYLWFVSPGQVNLQAPDDTPAGTVNVTVTSPSGTATSTVTLALLSPSFSLLDGKHVAGIILRTDGSGAYGGGAYDILGPTGTSLGYKTVAAKAGDTIELFGVGFGPTNPTVPSGKPYSGAAPTTIPVSLSIAGNTVLPAFSGITSAGLYQINVVQLPAGLGPGDMPLVATVAGVQTQTGVVISLQ